MDFIPQKSRNEEAKSGSLSSSPKNESSIFFYHFKIHKSTPKCFTRAQNTKTKAKGEVKVFNIWRMV